MTVVQWIEWMKKNNTLQLKPEQVLINIKTNISGKSKLVATHLKEKTR